MSEYIEKQAAIDELCYVDEYNSRSIATIREMKPADVRPVKRGRWVDEHVYKQTMGGKTYDGFTYCSNCKHDFSFGYRSKFCPDCGSYNGADMRGGDADGDTKD